MVRCHHCTTLSQIPNEEEAVKTWVLFLAVANGGSFPGFTCLSLSGHNTIKTNDQNHIPPMLSFVHSNAFNEVSEPNSWEQAGSTSSSSFDLFCRQSGDGRAMSSVRSAISPVSLKGPFSRFPQGTFMFFGRLARSLSGAGPRWSRGDTRI